MGEQFEEMHIVMKENGVVVEVVSKEKGRIFSRRKKAEFVFESVNSLKEWLKKFSWEE